MKALADQVAPALEAIRSDPKQAIGSLPYLIQTTPVEAAYQDLYARVGSDFADRTARMMKAEDAWIEHMRAFATTRAGERIRRVTQTTLSRVRSVLEQGVREGWGVDVMAERIARSNAVNLIRARVIARTEIISASNEGSMTGARSTGLQLNKVWLATDDERTRDTHRAIGGTSVDMNSKFMVGGFKGDYPGDPDLPVDEIVNCRCAIAFEGA